MCRRSHLLEVDGQDSEEQNLNGGTRRIPILMQSKKNVRKDRHEIDVATRAFPMGENRQRKMPKI
jgi:hypothetical protein